MKLYIIAIFSLLVLACHNNLEPTKAICLRKLTSLIKIPKSKKFVYNDDWRIRIVDDEYQIMEVLTYNNCCLDSVYIVKPEGELEYDLQLIQSDSLLNNSYLDQWFVKNFIKI